MLVSAASVLRGGPEEERLVKREVVREPFLVRECYVNFPGNLSQPLRSCQWFVVDTVHVSWLLKYRLLTANGHERSHSYNTSF